MESDWEELDSRRRFTSELVYLANSAVGRGEAEVILKGGAVLRGVLEDGGDFEIGLRSEGGAWWVDPNEVAAYRYLVSDKGGQ